MFSSKKWKFGIIGTGTIGTILAILLEKAGSECIGVNTRSIKSYERFCKYLRKEHLELTQLAMNSDILFLTTQDSSIEKVAAQLARNKLNKLGQVWIHCSGSLPSGVMRQDASLSVGYLSIHPLRAFADIESDLHLMAGVHFGIEGSNKECELLGEDLVNILGGISHYIDPAKKTLYHAGAVVAANYLVSLASMAVKMFNEAGIGQKAALEALLPLINGSVDNMDRVGLPYALTGPIARGDVEVVAKHLREIPSELKETYRGLGRLALEMAIEKKSKDGTNYPSEAYRVLKELLS